MTTSDWQIDIEPGREAVFKVDGGTIRCRVENGSLRVYAIADTRPPTHLDTLLIEPNVTNVVYISLKPRQP